VASVNAALLIERKDITIDVPRRSRDCRPAALLDISSLAGLPVILFG
jgi:hypothetical protein